MLKALRTGLLITVFFTVLTGIVYPLGVTALASTLPEAAARAFWPLGNTGLGKRLPLITAPTLVLWGEQDRVLPPSYAKKFAAGIAGQSRIDTIAGAGHLAYLDKPEAVARSVLAHIG